MNNKLQETLEFIYQVKNHPAVWYHGHNLHSDKVVCDAIWQNIGTRFNSSGQSAKSRWKNLRDNFRRELRRSELGLSGSTPEEYNSPWRYFQHMFFIKDQLRNHNISNPLNMPRKQNNVIKNSEPTPSTSQLNGHPTDDIEIEETTHDAFVREFPKSLAPKVTKPQEENPRREQFHKHIAEAMLASIDPDVGFLASLLPHLRAIPEERKALAKHHLTEVIVQHLDAVVDEPVGVCEEETDECPVGEDTVGIKDEEQIERVLSKGIKRKSSIKVEPEPESKKTATKDFPSEK